MISPNNSSAQAAAEKATKRRATPQGSRRRDGNHRNMLIDIDLPSGYLT